MAVEEFQPISDIEAALVYLIVWPMFSLLITILTMDTVIAISLA